MHIINDNIGFARGAWFEANSRQETRVVEIFSVEEFSLAHAWHHLLHVVQVDLQVEDITSYSMNYQYYHAVVDQV